MYQNSSISLTYLQQPPLSTFLLVLLRFKGKTSCFALVSLCYQLGQKLVGLYLLKLSVFRYRSQQIKKKNQIFQRSNKKILSLFISAKKLYLLASFLIVKISFFVLFFYPILIPDNFLPLENFEETRQNRHRVVKKTERYIKSTILEQQDMMNSKSPMIKNKKLTGLKIEPQKATIPPRSDKIIQGSSARKYLSPRSPPAPATFNRNLRTSSKANSHTNSQAAEPLQTQTLKFENHDEYEGPMKDGLFEGNGVYRMQEEALEYRGDFKNGLFDGFGTILESREGGRLIYEGEWKGGQKSGNGVYYYSGNQKYNGSWLENQKHGEGEYQSPVGSYKGLWEKDMKEGQGTLKLKKGITMIGKWSRNNFIQGKIVYSDGSTYSGQLNNYYRQNSGEYQYPSGSKFQGSWENNDKNGRGYYNFENGDYYEGGFKNNMKDGDNCIYRWKDDYEIRNASYREDKLISGTIYDTGKSEIKGNSFILE